MRFWQRLRDVMNEKELSADDLQFITGSTQKAVTSWILGTHNPPLKVVLEIADAVGMTASELLEGVDE